MMKTKSAVRPREIQRTVLNLEWPEPGVSRVGNGPFWSGVAVFGVTFVGMQGFTCVGRRLRWTFVNDDSFIWATLEPDRLIIAFISEKMTTEEPPDDEMFINASWSAKTPSALRRLNAGWRRSRSCLRPRPHREWARVVEHSSPGRTTANRLEKRDRSYECGQRGFLLLRTTCQPISRRRCSDSRATSTSTRRHPRLARHLSARSRG